MKNLNKLDKDLFSVMAMSDNMHINCIAYVENLVSAKRYFKGKQRVVAEFPFIKAVAIEANPSEIIDLCNRSWVKFITKQSSVMALMNVARKVLNIDEKLTGKGVTICYIDTGIKPHGDFTICKNRIIRFIDLFNDRKTPYDDNGHGTFVAGVGSGNGCLSGGKFKGIAPESNIISIKALNNVGEASAIVILEAMQWVYDNYKK